MIKDTRSENRIVISVTIIILQLKISAPVENVLYALFYSKNGTTNEILQKITPHNFLKTIN